MKHVYFTLLTFALPSLTYAASNVALSKPAVASQTESPYVAARAVDGRTSNTYSWRSDLGSNRTLEVDLSNGSAKRYTLLSAKILSGTVSSNIIKNYSISYLNSAGAWIQIANVPANTVMKSSVTFAAGIIAQKVRLACNNDSTSNCILRELQVMGNEYIAPVVVPASLVFNPASAILPSTYVGGQSVAQSFSVSNPGNVSSPACSGAVLSGANASEFLLAGASSCNAGIVGGGICNGISVLAKPLSVGAKAASLTLTCGTLSKSVALSYSASTPGTAEVAKFYMAPNGNDSNIGSISAPFATIEKLSSMLMAGDLAYIRGGTYTSKKGNSASIHFLMENLQGTAERPIKIHTYPGEVAVFDLSNISTIVTYPFAMSLHSSQHVHLKGRMILKNLRQVASGFGISRGFALENTSNSTIEFLDVFNMGGTGFALGNSHNNLILNVDSHHNGDGLSRDDDSPTVGSDAWDNADGFSSTGGDDSTDNVFDGCRAWLNSDDGWDFFAWAGSKVTIKNSQSFWHGIKPWGPNSAVSNEASMTPGNPSTFNVASYWSNSANAGEGFKLGGFGNGSPAGAPLVLKKHLHNNIAFENRGTGYAANMEGQYHHKMEFLNNIAYSNDNDGFGLGSGWSEGIAHIIRNNWSHGNNKKVYGDNFVYDGYYTNVSHNSWDLPVSISSADFLSVSSLGMDAPRQADGKLPVTNFLKLAPGSDLLDKGMNVGIPFQGIAPDLGAFEN